MQYILSKMSLLTNLIPFFRSEKYIFVYKVVLQLFLILKLKLTSSAMLIYYANLKIMTEMFPIGQIM